MFSLVQDDSAIVSPVPDVGDDLVAADAEGYFRGLPADRLMAALELVRHREISLQQAARLIGISKTMLVELLGKLPVEDFQQIAQNAA